MRFGVLMAALALISGPLAAKASTIDFTYTGTNVVAGVVGTASGTGSFSYVGTPTSLTLGSLTAFNFTDTFNINCCGTGIFTYSLADLTSFSATLSGNNLLSLSLATDQVNDSLATPYAQEDFVVNSLASGGAETISGASILTTIGQVTYPGETPEPSGLALLGTGLLSVMGVARRRLA